MTSNVFSEYKWYVDAYYEGELISRLFSTGEDGSTTSCERIGNHDNCYVTTSGDYYNFEVPRSAVLQGKEVDCSSYAELAGRDVDKCDIYTYSEGLWVKKVVVDSDTEYPVWVQTTDTGSEATITETVYLSFSDDKPKDKSGLEPFDGVTVYDFRDSRGDAGDGKSNVYTKASMLESLKTFVSSKFSLKNKMNSKKIESEKDPLDVYLKQSSFEKELREMLHLPPVGMPSKYLFHSNKKANRDNEAIPAAFDARDKWTGCKSVISTITNQDSCGSCWAMAGSSVLADRYCIKTGAKERLSPQYLVYCANHSNGCSGATSEIMVWEDMKEIGVPPESCIPFMGHNGECPTRCQDGTLINDTIKVHPSGYVIPWGDSDEERVKAIQREIMTNGPVEAFYLVFTDFSPFFLKSNGIYHRSKDARYKGGGHAIRIIGWGSENGEDYWLIANSYGTDHPAGGYFRMRRGNNECNLEEQVAAGIFN